MHRYPTRCGETGWSGRPPRSLLLSGEPKNERGGGRTHGCPAEGTARAKASRLDRPTDRELAVRTGHGANGGRTRGVGSPHPLPARPPQGPPPRSQLAPPALGSRGRRGASNGLRGPGSGEWSPAALMCGRPARRQLVPPRRPRAPIDTHQAAGGRERPLPRAPLPGRSGASRAGGRRRATRGGGRPAGGRPGLLSAAGGSALALSHLSLPAPVLVLRAPSAPILPRSRSPALRVGVSGTTDQPPQPGGFGLCPQPGTSRPPNTPHPLPVSPLPHLSPLGAWESQEAPLGTKPRPGGPGWGK